MSELSRIRVAIDAKLPARFDRFIENQRSANRFEALRDLMRDKVVGAIYHFHFRLLPNKLMDLQRGFHDLVIATTHAISATVPVPAVLSQSA
jgi:metal-responsive CopG/Arc/MetJ family transcriptional regulator